MIWSRGWRRNGGWRRWLRSCGRGRNGGRRRWLWSCGRRRNRGRRDLRWHRRRCVFSAGDEECEKEADCDGSGYRGSHVWVTSLKDLAALYRMTIWRGVLFPAKFQRSCARIKRLLHVPPVPACRLPAIGCYPKRPREVADSAAPFLGVCY